MMSQKFFDVPMPTRKTSKNLKMNIFTIMSKVKLDVSWDHMIRMTSQKMSQKKQLKKKKKKKIISQKNFKTNNVRFQLCRVSNKDTNQNIVEKKKSSNILDKYLRKNLRKKNILEKKFQTK